MRTTLISALSIWVGHTLVSSEHMLASSVDTFLRGGDMDDGHICPMADTCCVCLPKPTTPTHVSLAQVAAAMVISGQTIMSSYHL